MTFICLLLQVTMKTDGYVDRSLGMCIADTFPHFVYHFI